MSLELRDSLAQVQEMLGRATFGVLRADGHKDWFNPTVMLHSGDGIVARYHHGAPDFTCTVGKYEYELRNAEAVEACVNFVIQHGPALLAMMEDHSPDAGKMGEGVGTVADIPDHKLLERAVRWAARKRGRQPAWAKVADICALGSTYSAQLLRRFNLDPDTGKARAGERG